MHCRISETVSDVPSITSSDLTQNHQKIAYRLSSKGPENLEIFRTS